MYPIFNNNNNKKDRTEELRVTKRLPNQSMKQEQNQFSPLQIY